MESEIKVCCEIENGRSVKEYDEYRESNSDGGEGKEFVIMVDDCGRRGEQNLLREIQDILGRNHIEYSCGLYKSGGDCQVGVIVCKKWHFFASM